MAGVAHNNVPTAASLQQPMTVDREDEDEEILSDSLPLKEKMLEGSIVATDRLAACDPSMRTFQSSWSWCPSFSSRCPLKKKHSVDKQARDNQTDYVSVPKRDARETAVQVTVQQQQDLSADAPLGRVVLNRVNSTTSRISSSSQPLGQRAGCCSQCSQKWLIVLLLFLTTACLSFLAASLLSAFRNQGIGNT